MKPAMAQNSHGSFIQLPFELRHMVLAAAPDLPTLHALILSSPAYYDTFVASRDVILAEVLTRELGASKVIVEALAVYLTTISKPDTFPGFNFAMFERELCLGLVDAQWTVPSAFAFQLALNHRAVCKLTDDFFEEVLVRDQNDLTPPSKQERLRVQGAFYRVWLMGCLLARSSCEIPGYELAPKLNSAYASKWSLQEAVVVFDYLRDKLRPVILSSLPKDHSHHDESSCMALQHNSIESALTNLLAAGLPHIVSLLSTPTKSTDSITFIESSPPSSDLEKLHETWTVRQMLSRLTWQTDSHYDYEARRICEGYALWEPRWLYCREVKREACLFDDERLKAWGLQLPDQTPRPVHWFFSLGR